MHYHSAIIRMSVFASDVARQKLLKLAHGVDRARPLICSVQANGECWTIYSSVVAGTIELRQNVAPRFEENL